MNWLEEAVKIASGFVLGIFSGLMWPLFRERIAERKRQKETRMRKQQILQHLDDISSDIMSAVRATPHGVQNKDRWVARLKEFAKLHDEILGPLAGSVKRIAYRIEDATFDHGSSEEYCCDEVLADLSFLKLCILPVVAEEMKWDANTVEARQKELLSTIWFSLVEDMVILSHGESMKEYRAERANELFSRWTERQFRAPGKLAMATFINHERREEW